MCDAATMTVIQDVIAEKTGNDEMFTAFDVSRAVQSRGIKERHRNMKRDIHSQMSGFDGYNRTSVDIPGKGTAFLYHPDYADVESYDPDASAPQKAPCPTATASALLSSLDSDPDSDDEEGDESDEEDDNSSVVRTPQKGSKGTRTCQPKNGEVNGAPGRNGSVNVPSALLKAIGCGPKDGVRVQFDKSNNRLVLVPGAVPSNTMEKVRLVSYKGNIRIGQRALSKVGLGSLPAYNIKHVSKTIEIT